MPIRTTASSPCRVRARWRSQASSSAKAPARTSRPSSRAYRPRSLSRQARRIPCGGFTPEDGAGGVYRDLWNPNCKGHPGKVSDTAQYWCAESDQGGVHTNSGVPNHGFALLVDGGTYNGQTISGRRENRVPILRHGRRPQRRQFELHRHRLPVGPSGGRLQR
ncbi:MAG: M4 family metallopeptidase [Phycisphaerae bacterium]|nr:M4 family metallopeptidase [Phycisphaerae bacterium]